MAFDKLIPSWIANFTSNGTNVTIPIASVPELSAAEVDSVTGDIRKFMFAVCERIWSAWNALAGADRPTKMTVNKNSSVNSGTGIITHTYTFTFITAVAAQEVVAE